MGESDRQAKSRLTLRKAKNGGDIGQRQRCARIGLAHLAETRCVVVPAEITRQRQKDQW
jgi:hypothetical protein